MIRFLSDIEAEERQKPDPVEPAAAPSAQQGGRVVFLSDMDEEQKRTQLDADNQAWLEWAKTQKAERDAAAAGEQAPVPNKIKFVAPVPTFGENMRRAWQAGRLDADLNRLKFEAAMGRQDELFVDSIEKKYQAWKDEFGPRNESVFGVYSAGAVGMLPEMLAGATEGVQSGAAAAGIAGGAGAAVAGPAGALAAGVPAAGAGFAVGNTVHWWEQGTGEIYWDLRQEGVAPETAKVAAMIGAVPYALVEQLQFKQLIPGASKLIAPVKNAMKRGVKAAVLSVLKHGAENTLKEVGEEGLQKVITDATELSARAIEGQVKAEELPAEAAQIATDAWQEMVDTFGPVAVLELPSVGAGVARVSVGSKRKAGAAVAKPAAEGTTASADSGTVLELPAAGTRSEQDPDPLSTDVDRMLHGPSDQEEVGWLDAEERQDAEDRVREALGVPRREEETDVAGQGDTERQGASETVLPERQDGSDMPAARGVPVVQEESTAPASEGAGSSAAGDQGDVGADTEGLSALVDRAVADPQKASGRKVRYMPVHPDLGSAVKDAIGLDLSGYAHALDGSAVTHILSRHGEGNERNKGHVPVTRADFMRIPEVISNPDSVSYLGKNKRNQELIRYQKRINGHVFFVEEVRTGRKELAATSMWKIESGASNAKAEAEASSRTSKTLPGISTRKSIAPGGESVKGEGAQAARPLANVLSDDQKAAAEREWERRTKTMGDNRGAAGSPGLTAAAAGDQARPGSGAQPGFREAPQTAVSADDPTFSVLPIGMPEAVDLAKGLLGGKYPRVFKRLRLLRGMAAGVFRARGPLMEIELKADIFNLVQVDEKEALKAQVINGVLRDAGVDLNTLTDEARTVLLRKPELRNEIEQRYDAALAEKVEEAKKRDPTWAMAVVIHEIGHLVDYLPDRTLSRGNILGHIAALKDYTKQALAEAPANVDEAVDGRERAALRRLAEKQAAAELGQSAPKDRLSARTAAIYQQLLGDLFAKRDLVTKAEVKAELQALIAWWRGTETIPAYFEKPEEMYAEAFSVWVNNPGAFQKRAPAPWRLLRSYMEARPEFSARYQALQRAIASGQVYRDRVENLRRSWDEAGKVALSIEDATQAMSRREWKDAVLHTFWRRFGPIYDRMKGKAREQIEAVDRAIGDMLRHRNQHQRYLLELQNTVLEPLRALNLTYEDLREYMWHQYVVHEGFDKANPLGWTAAASQRRLDEMQETLGPARWAGLEAARQAFWANRKARVLSLLEKSGVPSASQVKLLFEREFYQTIQAERGEQVDPEAYSLDTMMAGLYGGRVGPKIFQRVGYLGKARDPLLATVEKDLSLISWAYRNMAKAAAVDFLIDTQDAGIREADYRFNPSTQRREPIERESDRMKTLYMVRDGQVRAYYMSRGLAEEFEADDPIAMKLAMRIARTSARWVKGGATGLNYGFWPFNYWRDTKDYVMNMPGVYSRVFGRNSYLKYMGRARRAAVSLIRGNPNEDAKAALDSMVLVPADLVYQHEETTDSIERIMLRNGVSPRVMNRMGGAKKAWATLVHYYTYLGRVAEIEPKIAGMLYLREHGPKMTEAELRRTVRGRAGSPDFMERAGAAWLMDMGVPFQNAAKEGLKSKVDTWRDPNVRKGEFLYKLFMYAVLPRVLKYGAGVAAWMYLRGSGGDDGEDRAGLEAWAADYQAMLDAIPEHSQLNYDVVPLGWADKGSGKVLYLRGPETEYERLVGGLADMTYRSLTGKADARGGLALLNMAGSQLPGLNPVLSPFATAWDYWVRDRNPYDAWSGGQILTDTEMTAGGPQAWAKMGKHVWNDMTFGLITRFDMQNPYPGSKSRAEKVLAWPIISNLVGRWLRVSNAGIREKAERAMKPEEKRRARLLLDANQTVRELLEGNLSPASEDRMASKEYQDAVRDRLMEARREIGVDPISQELRKAGPRQKANLMNLLDSR